MSRQTFIFVGAQAGDPDLVHLVEQALGGTFRYEEGSDPYIRIGTVAVYVGGHEFDDDDITWPGGSDMPLRSVYPAMMSSVIPVATSSVSRQSPGRSSPPWSRPAGASRIHRRYAESTEQLSA